MKQVNVGEYVALVSDEHFHYVSPYRWGVQHGGKNLYAVASIDGKKVLMHRLIMSAPPGTFVDHIDGDGLNNQRQNLRFCTKAQNFQNGRWRNKPGRTSPYKGVWRIKRRCRRCWRAGITANRLYRNIGTYWTDVEAAKAYDNEARRLHGEFARLNFPDLHGDLVPPGTFQNVTGMDETTKGTPPEAESLASSSSPLCGPSVQRDEQRARPRRRGRRE